MITQAAIYSPQNRAAHAFSSREAEDKLIKAKRIIAELTQTNESLASTVISLECKVKLLSQNRHELQHTIKQMEKKADNQADIITGAKYRIRCLVAKLMTYESSSQKIFDIGIHVNVIDMVAGYYGMTAADLQVRSRKRGVKTCRHTICYLLKKYTELSLLEIARLVGLSDHTSALHAISRVGELIDQDAHYNETVAFLCSKIDEVIANQSNNNKPSC